MFFVVPFKTQHVDHVIKTGQRELACTTRRQREYGRETDKLVHTDGQGFLQIHGADDQLIEVSVSPASLKNVADKSNEFLTSSKESSMTIFAVASWKFGVLMGGVLTLFTRLYVVGYTLGFLNWIFAGLKRTLFGGSANGT